MRGFLLAGTPARIPFVILRAGSLLSRGPVNEVPLLLVAMAFERFLQRNCILLGERAFEIAGSGTSVLAQPIWWVCGDPNIEALTFGNNIDPPSI